METLTKLCFAVEEIGSADNTPAGLALVRLACTTAALLTTSVIEAPDNAAICNDWLSSREDYQLLTMQTGQ
jgi:hypothetical protein